jgi:hypothetical protein
VTPSAVAAGLLDAIPEIPPVSSETQQWWTWTIVLMLGAVVWRLTNRFISSS